MQVEAARITSVKWAALVTRAVAGGNLVLALGVKDSSNLSDTEGVDFLTVCSETVFQNDNVIEAASAGFYPYLAATGKLDETYNQLLSKVEAYEGMPAAEQRKLQVKRLALAADMTAHSGETQDAAFEAWIEGEKGPVPMQQQ